MLLENILNEFSSAGNPNGYIFDDHLIPKYNLILSEFTKYIARLGTVPKQYKDLLDEFITLMLSTFPQLLPLRPMLINPNQYDITAWGKLYWDFLHYSSIFLQYAVYTGLVQNIANFQTILYHIDYGLPCSMCKYNYKLIKDTIEVKNIIENLCYGYIARSVYDFHRIINNHIESRKDDSYYSQIDFLLEYQTLGLMIQIPKTQTEYRCLPLVFASRKYAIVLSILAYISGLTIKDIVFDSVIKELYNLPTTEIDHLNEHEAIFVKYFTQLKQKDQSEAKKALNKFVSNSVQLIRTNKSDYKSTRKSMAQKHPEFKVLFSKDNDLPELVMPTYNKLIQFSSEI